jgi:hypothetical protein
MREIVSPPDTVTPTWQYLPSWSWAALHKPVYWSPELDDKELYHICDIYLLQHSEPSQLQLSGMLMQCPNNYAYLSTSDCAWILGPRWIEGSDSSGFILAFSPDQWFDATLSQCPQYKTNAASSIQFEDEILKCFLGSVYIMPILYHQKPLEGGSNRLTVFCLLLQAQSGLGCGIYRRVGMMRAHKNSAEEMDSDSIISIIRAWQKPIDDGLFEEVDGDGNYTVKVI